MSIKFYKIDIDTKSKTEITEILLSNGFSNSSVSDVLTYKKGGAKSLTLFKNPNGDCDIVSFIKEDMTSAVESRMIEKIKKSKIISNSIEELGLELDPILDKISRAGISSLSRKELIYLSKYNSK